jgi:hypothetical protein
LVKASPQPIFGATQLRKQKEQKPMVLKKEIVETYGLPSNIVNEAQRMANAYPDVYVFENTIRYLVKSILEKRYGAKWWHQKDVVSNAIRREVEARKNQERQNRWHSQRGSHEIFYTNFGDLSSIISTNWDDFKSLFPDLKWIQSRMEEIEQSRNIIAHNNPLPPREVDRIDMYYKDLLRQLGKESIAN